MEEKFSTFVISQTTLSQIRALPSEIQLKFFWAVSSYGMDGVEPDFEGLELAVWIPMRDLILHSKRKDEAWRQRQRKNGSKGGRPKTQDNPENPRVISETQINPDDVWVNSESHNDNENENINDNEFTEPQNFQDKQAISMAKAIVQKGNNVLTSTVEQAIVPVSQSPPAKKVRGLELNREQLALFNAAKSCFESSERTKAMIFKDKNTVAMQMRKLKEIVVACTNIEPNFPADFLRMILDHFRIMTNGKLKGKAEFTPRALSTPWVWEAVVGSLPENNITPELQKSIKGLFK
jgi:hypothetical protein